MFKNLQQIRKTLAGLIYKNTLSPSDQFFRYGNKGITPKWSDVVMSDRDMYSGYSYAVIRNRSNTVARVATDNVRSNNQDTAHPYLELIESSRYFSEYSFWSDISTYIDLEGVYYLMAVRAIGEGRVGNIVDFKLLNPYNIKRVINKNTKEVEGYVESKSGLVREIPKEMIIEIRELNPFDSDNTYSMTDAAKESQFTLKTAGDYTRQALVNNTNAPGIISTDVILPDIDFQRFVERMRNRTKGEPIFGNGSGAVTYEAMSQNLKDSALDVVSDTTRDQLFAISGVSKTIMGIEESGTTRETAKVQKDLNIESQILPRIQLIIDALNLDYIKYYNDKEIYLVVDNPQGSDYDAKLKEQELKAKQLETYNSLLGSGYSQEIASNYVMGEIEVDGLGVPEKKELIDDSEDTEDDTDEEEVNSYNKLEQYSQGLISQQQGALQNAVVNIETKIAGTIIENLRRKMSKTNVNDASSEIDFSETDLISKKEKKENTSELLLSLTAFYGIVMMLEGDKQMKKRIKETSLGGVFKVDSQVNKYVKSVSNKVATSHVDTVSSQLYELARREALAGKSVDEIVSTIKKEYNTSIIEGRAKTVARTETNRAFTRSQYEADTQFVEQNKLQNRVFKQWVTRSDNPCPLCQSLEDQGKIPFNEAFAGIGDTVRAGDDIIEISFETVEAGNLHPNCSCTYQLIIEPEKNQIEKQQKELEVATNEIRELISEIL